MRRVGKVWIRVYPDLPVTQKPAEVRMGSGKGGVEYWACRVYPGTIMFEMDGVDAEVAHRALILASAKLPVLTKIVTRGE
jgi:large subunit ribosomal protein L16